MNSAKSRSFLAMANIALGVSIPYVHSLKHLPAIEHVTWTLLLWATVESAWLWSKSIAPNRNVMFQMFITLLLVQVLASSIVAYLGFFGLLSVSAALILSGVLLYLSVQALSGKERIADQQVNEIIPLKTRRILIASSTTILLACSLVALNYLRYPTQDADNMVYHLPMVAEWMRNSSIWPTTKSPIPMVAVGYPGMRESLVTFLGLPLHNEHLGVVGLLEPMLFCAAVLFLSQEFTRSIQVSAVTATYAATVPMVVSSCRGNDLSLAIWLVCAVLFLLEFTKEKKTGSAILAGVAVGSVAATKYSGFIYAPLTILIILTPHLLRDLSLRNNQWGKRELIRLLYLIIVAIAIALPWYLRNLIMWRNPIYPAEVKVFGLSIFEGPVQQATLSGTSLGWKVEPLFIHGSHFFDAFGWLILFIGLGSIFAVVSNLRSFSGMRLPQATVSILAVLLFAAFLHQPYSKPSFHFEYNMRYLIPWFALSLVVTVSCFRNRLAANLAMVSLAVATCISMAQWTRFWWLIAVCAALAVMLTKVEIKINCELLLQKISKQWRIRTALLVTGIIIGTNLHQQQTTIRYTDWSSAYGWGDLCNFVHRNITEERILVTGDDRFFPIYGDNFGNSVTLLSGRHSASHVLNSARDSNATMIVAFRPIARQDKNGYEFGESVGSQLIHEFPEQIEVIFQSKGCFVLKLAPFGVGVLSES